MKKILTVFALVVISVNACAHTEPISTNSDANQKKKNNVLRDLVGVHLIINISKELTAAGVQQFFLKSDVEFELSSVGLELYSKKEISSVRGNPTFKITVISSKAKKGNLYAWNAEAGLYETGDLIRQDATLTSVGKVTSASWFKQDIGISEKSQLDQVIIKKITTFVKSFTKDYEAANR